MMVEGSQRGVALGTTAAGVLLLVAAPTPAACLRALAAAGTTTDQSAPLVAVLALLAWALAAWLALTVLLTAGGHLPGQAGRALHALARRVAPTAVRRGVEVALGLTVVVGTLAAPAAAAPGSEAPRAGAPLVSLDWAAPAPGSPAPDLDWSATAEPAVPSPPAPAEAAPVVVQPGDTLWDLAEQDLRAALTATESTATEPNAAEPTDAAVAAAWPAWWSANREVVGDDPDLLRPGTPLAPPEDPPASG